MTTDVEFDLREMVLGNSAFGPAEIEQISKAIARDMTNLAVLRDAAHELDANEERSPAATVRLGVCFYLMGRYRSAIETLAAADGGALAHWYLGQSHFVLENFTEATRCYEAAKKAGYDKDRCSLAIAEAMRYSKDAAGALKVLDELFGAVEQTAEYLYQRGATVAAVGDNPGEVVALYERAVQVDGSHSGGLFGLALENDRRGNDERALELYQRASGSWPAHVGSLLNLGLLYEDRGQYDRAQQCYRRILDVFPTHRMTRLYMKDTAAAGDMYYDEEAQKRRDRLAQVLNIPVTDFELSVRSRNCLQKMGVRTLGDLTRTSEAELLASKNFGETSLVEISEILNARGLELGQFAHEKVEVEPVVEYQTVSPDEQAMFERPISDLNLSVRARKCMVRLGLNTLGELVRKTGDDLLECKNFGVTSLNEVREKLTGIGMKLRGD